MQPAKEPLSHRQSLTLAQWGIIRCKEVRLYLNVLRLLLQAVHNVPGWLNAGLCYHVFECHWVGR